MNKPDLLHRGVLYGRLPGPRKDWALFYLEVTSSQLHIFEAHEDPQESRKHLRSLEISRGDDAGEERTRERKREFSFYVQRADGRYLFKCDTAEQRREWLTQLHRVVNKQQFQAMPDFTPPTPNVFDPDNVGSSPSSPMQVDIPRPTPRTPPAGHQPRSSTLTRGKSFSDGRISALDQPLPAIPGENSGSGFDRASIISSDSGIGPSVEGEVRRSKGMHRSGSSSVPSSADGTFRRGGDSSQSKSDGGMFDVRQVVQVESGNTEELENYRWFWGSMNRQECEKTLKTDGEVGNFVVRINATGDYVMSFWRRDGVHHHKIAQYGNMYRFERSTVQAEGYSIVDLLDTYMKNCADKSNIKPFGGALHLVYDEPWNPPEIDMVQLGEKLREQKRKERPKHVAASPSTSHKLSGEDYTPAEEVDKFCSSSEGRSTSRSGRKKPHPEPHLKPKRGLEQQHKPLPEPPITSMKRDDSSGKFKPLPPTPQEIATPEQQKKKPLPPTPAPRMTREGNPSQAKGWALPGLLEEMKAPQRKKQSAPAPSPKPKPKPYSKQPTAPELYPSLQPQAEEPQYANMNFPGATLHQNLSASLPPYQNVDFSEPESYYMNMGTAHRHGAALNTSTQFNGHSQPLNPSVGEYQNVTFGKNSRKPRR